MSEKVRDGLHTRLPLVGPPLAFYVQLDRLFSSRLRTAPYRGAARRLDCPVRITNPPAVSRGWGLQDLNQGLAHVSPLSEIVLTLLIGGRTEHLFASAIRNHEALPVATTPAERTFMRQPHDNPAPRRNLNHCQVGDYCCFHCSSPFRVLTFADLFPHLGRARCQERILRGALYRRVASRHDCPVPATNRLAVS